MSNDEKGAAMPERDGYMPGVPCWVDTSQPDPEAAVAFYGGLFGWEFEDAMPPGSAGELLHRSAPGRRRGRGRSQPPGGPARRVEHVRLGRQRRRDRRKVLEAGGRVVIEPFDVGDAGRMAVFTDPEGAAFCVWQANRHQGARIVNEPGSVNFNSLNTRDVEGAKAFYGSVFGWDTLRSPAAPRCGGCRATAISSSSASPGSASGWRRPRRPRRASRTSSRHSFRSLTTKPTSRRTGA